MDERNDAPGPMHRADELVRAAAAGTRLRGARVGGVLPDALALTRLAGEALDFSAATLVRAVLSQAQLSDCNFAGAQLAHADFGAATLRGCCFDRANLRGASLEGARFEDAQAAALDAAGSRWRRARLIDSRLERASLDQADLSEIVGDGLSLRGASLRGASLRAARLLDVDFRGADLSGADLAGADLSGADFRGALLDGAVFTACVLAGAQFDAGAGPLARGEAAPAIGGADARADQPATADLQALLAQVLGATTTGAGATPQVSPQVLGELLSHLECGDSGAEAFARLDAGLVRSRLTSQPTLAPLVELLRRLESEPSENDDETAAARWLPVIEQLFPEVRDREATGSLDELAARLNATMRGGKP